MEKSGFFNSVDGDRKYKADWFAEYFGSFIGNGVFPNPSNNLQVMADNGLNITITKGKGWINGYYYHLTDNLTITLDNADGVLKRIDRVVLQYNLSQRLIKVVIKKGVFASSPTAPILTRDANVFELGLATVLINNGQTQLSQANITDTRLNSSICGLVSGTVESVDVTTLFNQYQQAFIDKTTDFEADFNDWFNTIQDILDESTAGNLLNLINANTAEISLSLYKNEFEYQTAVVVSREIQLKATTTSRIPFKLNSAITGGAITIKVGSNTALPLKDVASVDVTELEVGFYEVIADATFFTLRPSGGSGLKSYFGEGEDGVIPNLNTITTAPNGGTVANLWDMNAGTVFTTETLSSASDQVVFEIDFGSTHIMPSSHTAIGLDQVILSTGTRTVSLESSNDGVVWTQRGTNSGVSTTPTLRSLISNGANARFWRVLLKAGGSNCTLTMQGAMINYLSGETSLTHVWRNFLPSTLNGGAVVKKYSSLTLPVGYEITTQNPCQGLVLYSEGDVNIAGRIDMSQKASVAPNGNTVPMVLSDFKVTDPTGVDMFNKLTTQLLNLKGGAGGNGGYGGGYTGSTGRQASVGIGGAGRQNLGGFGGGGSGGTTGDGVNRNGGIGGSISNAEIGGGRISISLATYLNLLNGVNGSGGIGGVTSPSGLSIGNTGICFGGGTGGTGASRNTASSSTLNSQYAGGFIMVIAKGNLTIIGDIISNGGSGSNGGNAQASDNNFAGGGGGGGGAGGGVIQILHKGIYTNSGTLQVNGGAGGTGGAGVGSGEAGGSGTSGSVGTISITQI